MLKSIKNMSIFIILLFLIYLFTYFESVRIWDNLWNFHFIQGIETGLVPYRDMNLIVPPLFHFVGAFLFKLLGTNFYSFNIYGCLINTCIVVGILSLIRLYSNNKKVIILTIFITLIPLVLSQCANYNYMIIIFPIAILYLEKKQKNKNTYYNFLTGILLALTALTKHTIGFVFIAAYLVYYLVNYIIEKKNSTENKQFKLKNLCFLILGIIVPLLLFLVYLITNRAFVDFINYCVGGIFEFSKKNSALTGLALPIIITFFATFFSVIANSYKKDNCYLLLILFSIASCFIAYPIANSYHMAVASIIPVAFLIITLYNVFINFKEESKKIYKKALNFLCISTILLVFILCIKKSLEVKTPYLLNNFDNELSVYNGNITITQKDISAIKNIKDFINYKEKEGYNVIILSSDASLYEIPYNVWHNDYDLLLNGNLGKKGIERVKSNLSSIQNPLFLKSNLGETNGQEIQEIEDFVINNYTNIESIEGLRVFVSKGVLNNGN